MVDRAGSCVQCGEPVTHTAPGLDPTRCGACGPNRWAEPDGPKPFDLNMARDIKEVIWWAWRHDTRSQQVMLGPSELGEPCRRKLAYRIAGVRPVNKNVDPWPALVGTAIHRYLEEAINRFQAEAGAVRWLTEVTVQVDDMVVGHVDLFDLETGSVWDFKSMGSTKLKEFSSTGQPSEEHRTQVHLYGLGMERAGYEVGSVGLIAVPRSGWLANTFVWSEPYDPEAAKQALNRMYTVAEEVLELQVDVHPEQVMAVEASPSRMCQFCDFYQPDQNGQKIGCPGK